MGPANFGSSRPEINQDNHTLRAPDDNLYHPGATVLRSSTNTTGQSHADKRKHAKQIKACLIIGHEVQGGYCALTATSVIERPRGKKKLV